MSSPNPIHLLRGEPSIPPGFANRVRDDYRAFAERGLPDDWSEYVRHHYEMDLSSTYADMPIRNPFGKASGQLSMTLGQVKDDIDSELGFIVLKTVIAEDESGVQTMSPWSVREAKMTVEPITGQSGEVGWTVSWKGRGWWRSFDDYLELVSDAACLSRGTSIPIVPSVKFHLPTEDGEEWRNAEYHHTTRKLLAAWRTGMGDTTPMPLEKDFSPTLAGSEKARDQARILEWLREVPGFIRESVPADSVCIGLKIMNALYEDEFQRCMIDEVNQASSDADFFIYGNRLFDPNRVYDDHQGIAYGGPDLSDRNLRIMSTMEPGRLPWSATGNITTGRMAMEYALCGASSFQMHTIFQLPATEYSMKQGSRTERTLHELVFHPQTGLLVWMKDIADRIEVSQKPIRFTDLVGLRNRVLE
ncbi:beta/alpha barrel domain-containing protein [Thalassoroseus pseudoceratinae]|uniref:hypothetical protein n=1 Tax=Thalassoroseus pseudoceratinae TaxID=2713176 RepID=UPI00141EECC1|nr:hypothetical protein [Thalassoroseus pseudoceratinae]